VESQFAKALRPFWVGGLNSLTGTHDTLLLEVFDSRRDYVFFYPIQRDFFRATITAYQPFLSGFAADINRFGCAAVESVNEIHYKASLSKSHSWKCVKLYYAAYYAAHAMLRMHGISCINFERENLREVEKVADLWTMRNGVSIDKGYYQCKLDPVAQEILCSKIVSNGNKGSHEQLWMVFLRQIQNIISELAKSPATPETQSVLNKLQDLENTLTAFGSNGGNWLSTVRNKISYKHVDGLWYPYKKAEKYFSKIESIISKWLQFPDDLDLASNDSKPILRFLDACIFIVSLYLNTASDMAILCPKGVSFQKQGVLSFINKLQR
jgi:hypothetical protein